MSSLTAGSSSSSSVLHSHSHNQHNMQHNGDGAFSDSGQGSEPDDGTIMCYQFKLPCYITGDSQTLQNESILALDVHAKRGTLLKSGLSVSMEPPY